MRLFNHSAKLDVFFLHRHCSYFYHQVFVSVPDCEYGHICACEAALSGAADDKWWCQNQTGGWHGSR